MISIITFVSITRVASLSFVATLLDGESVVIRGTCVREEILEPEERTIWRAKVVIAVDDADPGYAKLVATLGDPRSG